MDHHMRGQHKLKLPTDMGGQDLILLTNPMAEMGKVLKST